MLRTEADPVTDSAHALRTLVSDLMDTLWKIPSRAGVAAPQIGVSLRVCVVAVEKRRAHVVNPTITVARQPHTEPATPATGSGR